MVSDLGFAVCIVVVVSHWPLINNNWTVPDVTKVKLKHNFGHFLNVYDVHFLLLLLANAYNSI